jgi:4'-phosphopantetheinyl transferase
MITRCPLPENEIHLWLVCPQKIRQQSLLKHYRSLLNAEERVRWQRFKFEKHQHQYLVTRALVRTTLSRYAPIMPKEWAFSNNKYGKPEISPPQNLFFNLSHTHSLIVCAIVREKNIGVDVETIEHKTSLLEIAQRFFSTQEFTRLSAESGIQQKQRFFQYWTLKEAYIKAKGLGLSQPLNQFSFEINPQSQQLTLSFDPQLSENFRHWSCWLLQMETQHFLSLCLYNPQPINYKLRLNYITPFLEEKSLDYTLIART